MAKTIRSILQSIAKDARLLQMLRDDPDGLVRKLKLSKEQAKALRGADLLLKFVKNPLEVMQTTTPITITGRPPHRVGENSGDPVTRLDQLSKEQLVHVVERVLADEYYAGQLKDFLKIGPVKSHR